MTPRLNSTALQVSRLRVAIALDLCAFGDLRLQPSFNAVMCFQNRLTLLLPPVPTTTQVRHQRDTARYTDWTWGPNKRCPRSQTNLFYFTDAGQPARNNQPGAPGPAMTQALRAPCLGPADTTMT